MPKRSLRQRLSRSIELPEMAFPGCSYLTVEGNSSLRVDHCREILAYGENEIRLDLPGFELWIVGEELTMRSYAVETICISGTLHRLQFEIPSQRKGE